MTDVPYKGTAPAMNDLVGGEVDLMCDDDRHHRTDHRQGDQGLRGHLDEGDYDAGAEGPADARRSRAEGLQRDHLARPVRAQGHAEGGARKGQRALKVALKDPEFIKREEALGAVIITDGPVNGAEHKKFVEAEITKWGPIIKAAGQYAD